MKRALASIIILGTIIIQGCLFSSTEISEPTTVLEDTFEGCSDGLDNDLDGYTDCDDQDCAIFARCLSIESSAAFQSSVISEPEYPDQINITIHGVVIAPSKSSGNPWDGTEIDVATIKAFQDLIAKVTGKDYIGGESVIKVVSYLSDQANTVFGPPDAEIKAAIDIG
ncbi:MAG: hypothetical protein OCC49_16160 [Fibrobacterales bacterium]